MVDHSYKLLIVSRLKHIDGTFALRPGKCGRAHASQIKRGS